MANVLKNSSFESGWYHKDGKPEFQIPNEWVFTDLGTGTANPHDPNPWARFVPPEVRVMLREQLPPHEQDDFILHGNRCIKIFKGHGSWHGSLAQVVDLGTGSYELTIKLFADLVKEYGPEGKVWADDPQGRDGLVRLSGGSTKSEWFSLKPGQLNTLSVKFDANGMTTVTVEMMCPFPLNNSGVFGDDWQLDLVSDGDHGRCRPRRQYPRTYILLPEEASEEWAIAAASGAREPRWTVGYSADDAGIGDLDDRTVIAVNPEQIQVGGTAAWYETHYPGVKYMPVTVQTPTALKNKLAEMVEASQETTTHGTPGSMLGLHLQTEYAGWESYVAAVKPGMVKIFQFDLAPRIKELSPNTLVVARYWIAHQQPYIFAADKPQAAREFIGRFRPSLERYADSIDVMLDLNEYIGTDDLDGIQNGVAWAVAFAEELAALDLPVAPGLLSVAVGNPQHGEQTRMLLPAAQAAEEFGGYLVYHGYWPANRLESGWQHYAGRALESWDPEFSAADVHPCYLFGELGVVGAHNHSLDAMAGWKHELAYDADWGRYLADLLRFDALVAAWNEEHENRARGGCIFTTGADYIGWKEFQIRTEEMHNLQDALV